MLVMNIDGMDLLNIYVNSSDHKLGRYNGKFGINTTSPGSLLSVSGGTSDDSFIRMNNEEVGLYFGAWGTGSSYPRETTINGTRFDNGTSPWLRVAGQGGIKFCVDLNNERLRIDSNSRVISGGSLVTSKF